METKNEHRKLLTSQPASQQRDSLKTGTDKVSSLNTMLGGVAIVYYRDIVREPHNKGTFEKERRTKDIIASLHSN